MYGGECLIRAQHLCKVADVTLEELERAQLITCIRRNDMNLRGGTKLMQRFCRPANISYPCINRLAKALGIKYSKHTKDENAVFIDATFVMMEEKGEVERFARMEALFFECFDFQGTPEFGGEYSAQELELIHSMVDFTNIVLVVPSVRMQILLAKMRQIKKRLIRY